LAPSYNFIKIALPYSTDMYLKKNSVPNQKYKI